MATLNSKKANQKSSTSHLSKLQIVSPISSTAHRQLTSNGKQNSRPDLSDDAKNILCMIEKSSIAIQQPNILGGVPSYKYTFPQEF